MGPATMRQSLAVSFQAAFTGLLCAIRRQRNLRIHCAAAISAIVLAVWLGFSPFEMVVILLVIAVVMISELLNSAIEQTVDLCVGTNISDGARLAKDISAAAVLVGALLAAAIGAILYIPALWHRLI